MKRAILIAVLLIALSASAVLAAVPAVASWTDNFESYANNTRLRVAWGSALTGPENYINPTGVTVPGGDKAVRLKGSSSAGTTSSADKLVTAVVGLQILHFTLQGDTAHMLGGYNHAYVKLNTAAGGELGYWYGSSAGMNARIGGNVIAGSGVSLADGLVHDFDIAYNPLSGATNWYADGVLKGTWAGTAGQIGGSVYVQDTHRVDDLGAAVNDWIWLDDMAFGTNAVPEPSSLLALSVFGAGAFGFMRRRRA